MGRPAALSAEEIEPQGFVDLVPVRARRMRKITAKDCEIRGGEYNAHRDALPNDMVDCILPFRIRKLGSGATYLAPREILASVYDYLYRSGVEKPRYGLYSYVLLPSPTLRGERLLAEIFATTSFVELNRITIANINLMYIPVKSPKISSLIPLVSDGSAPPTKVFSAEYYDYALAQKLLAQICRSPPDAIRDVCSTDLTRGPYLFTFSRPASAMQTIPPPHLFVDLSDVHEKAFGEFVAAYKAQVKRPHFNDKEKIDSLHLGILSIVLTAADWIDPIKGALANSVRMSDQDDADH